MIGFRERDRTRERRLSWARVAIFFLWVILVFSLISLFFFMENESKTSTRPLPPRPRLLKRRSFSRALFHTPSSTTQKTKVVSANNGDPHHTTTLYGDDKRIIHTGPNPLHN
ncbi:CLAVATA3/ESR (CLE)-related protein 17 [Spatholobus suberectus]|nr:CLAVATA3/ESR (CLE)-related protein 17 [Spatholobus suberectus]